MGIFYISISRTRTRVATSANASSENPTLSPPPMDKVSPLFILLLLPLSLHLLSDLPIASGDGEASSIRSLLRAYGLPPGLLPKSVDSFSFQSSSGLLEVHLQGPCFAHYEDGLAHFDSVVKGNLSYGAMREVVGWSQEELFLWLPVKGILVADPNSGVILFDIGVAHKRLSASVFEEPPDCRPAGELAEEGPLATRGALEQ